jgi:hypothetical protein
MVAWKRVLLAGAAGSLAVPFLWAPLALAASWADFSPLFPVYPCADGWVGCRVGGVTVSPEPARDSKGMPVPSNLRVGWDLQPTAAFSPFTGLSAYTGRLEAPAPPPEPPREVASRVEAPRDPPSDGGGGEAPERAPDVPPSVAKVEPPPPPPPPVERPTTPPPGVADPPPVAKVAPPPPVVAKVEPPPPPPVTRPPPDPEPVAAPIALPPPPVTAVAAAKVDPGVATAVDDSCDDLTAIEPMAMLGKLTKGQEQCLEEAYQAGAKQTEKDKVSRVLMSNAYAAGRKGDWEKLVKRHLEDVDQSDPDLCYKYALHLSRLGAARASGVIRWSNVALENKTVWTGETYKSRVSALYKLRAAAAQSAWEAAEASHAAAPTDATKSAAEAARNQTKVYAREWYEYAKAAGKDSSQALQLCVSAAGSNTYCEGT